MLEYYGFHKDTLFNYQELLFFQGNGGPFWCPAAENWDFDSGPGTWDPNVLLPIPRFKNDRDEHGLTYMATTTTTWRNGGWGRCDGAGDPMLQQSVKIIKTVPTSCIMIEEQPVRGWLNGVYASPNQANNNNIMHGPTWRHWNGANFLLLDGSVQNYKKTSYFNEDYVKQEQ
jgi:prepilin-type processing-associated H-X9-DG protein